MTQYPLYINWEMIFFMLFSVEIIGAEEVFYATVPHRKKAETPALLSYKEKHE